MLTGVEVNIDYVMVLMDLYLFIYINLQYH